MKRLTPMFAGAALLAAGPALADNGVRPIWQDFQPAVSTQYRPADGGRIYRKPNTLDLQQDVPAPRAVSDPNGTQRRPLPPGTSTNPADKPPSQVGR